MPLAHGATVLAITGPFGSGCSTVAAILSDRLGYKSLRLSDLIREEGRRRPHRSKLQRQNLQALGNEIRRERNDPGALARIAIQRLDSLGETNDKVVLDGIRNVGEIEVLRELFGHSCYTIALECPANQRFDRLQPIYGNDARALDRFRTDNENDRDQENPFGQQVALCVDLADVLVINDNAVTQTELRRKLLDFVSVITGESPRYPTPTEILMNFAYSASHASKCLKRQVGAVIVSAEPGKIGEVTGQGFNENPQPTAPCVEEPRYGADPSRRVPGRCYRDIVRTESLAGLARERRGCPSCGARMRQPADEPPWNCHSCGVNLEGFFWPERAMTLCTAVHAEVAAIMTAGRSARGGTLYTTTFPCFQCAEKITQAGIRWIVFTEPYPDVRAADRLEIAGIKTLRFEGVRSRRFDEIFSRARPYVAAQRRASATLRAKITPK